eukprot:1982038-Pyramimonas_sp.AAC.1
MPLLASIAVACCPRARIPSSVPYALRTAFAVSSKLQPALMICIQDAGNGLVWYLHSSSISNATIDAMTDLVFLLVDTRQCNRWHNRMPRLAPALHSRHVSQTPVIRWSLTLSRPILAKTSLILGSFAWNQRKCSCRSSRLTTLGSRFRKFCKLFCTWNRDQPGSRGRTAGLPAGGGGGASPPCRRPRLTLTCGSRRWSSELPAPLEPGCPAAGSAACPTTGISWLLAPAVGQALEPGLGARSRVSGGAAGASGWWCCWFSRSWSFRSCCWFGRSQWYLSTIVRQLPRAVSYTHLTLPTILLV